MDVTAGRGAALQRRAWPTRSSPRAPAAGRSRRPTRSVRRAARISSRCTDPYDTISPYHDWGPVPVTGDDARERGRRGGPRRRRDGQAQLVAGASKTLKVTSLSRGAEQLTASIGGATVASALAPPLDVVQRRRPLAAAAVAESRRSAAGTRVTLSGVVRGVTEWSSRDPSPVRRGTQLRSIASTGAFHLSRQAEGDDPVSAGDPNDAAAPVRIRVQTATVR